VAEWDYMTRGAKAGVKEILGYTPELVSFSGQLMNLLIGQTPHYSIYSCVIIKEEGLTSFYSPFLSIATLGAVIATILVCVVYC